MVLILDLDEVLCFISEFIYFSLLFLCILNDFLPIGSPEGKPFGELMFIFWVCVTVILVFASIFG